jgi:hypothetical protein
MSKSDSTKSPRSHHPTLAKQDDDAPHLQLGRYEADRARSIAIQAAMGGNQRAPLAENTDDGEGKRITTMLGAATEIRLLTYQLSIRPTEVLDRDHLIRLAVNVKASTLLNPPAVESLSKMQRETALLQHPAAAELLALFVESLVRLADSTEGMPSRSKQHPEGLTTGKFRGLLASAFRAQGEHGGRSISTSRCESLNKIFRKFFLGSGNAVRKGPLELERHRRLALDKVYEALRRKPAPAGTEHHDEIISLLGPAYQITLDDNRASS